MISAALEYAALGWPVLPIVPRGKIPLTAHGLKDATTSTATIESWWEQWPDANIAVRTDDHVVIDCDGFAGKHTFGLFIGSVGFASSPYAWTGGGGLHVWYSRGDTQIRNRAGWLEHVDIRSEGGYVIVPPSVHANGRDYYWEYSPAEKPVPPLPELLRDALTSCSDSAVTVSNMLEKITIRTSGARTGSKYATVALDGETDKVRAAPVGQRNATLVAAAFSLGQLVAVGKLEPGQVAGALLGAATSAGLPATEAARTIASGMRGGAERPRSR